VILQPIDYVVYAWLAIALLSAAYVAVDQFRHNPEATVMKWGFVLVTLYMGPIGLLLYVFADKEPAPGTHEEFIAPLWKQGVGSTVHCVAGDATGIIFAAAVTALLGFPMWADLIVEYLAGFLFGWLIFQSLFMRAVMGGTYRENVRRTFLPEMLSMNLMMAGMAPVMTTLMMGRDMRAMWPGEPLFWFVMSLAVTAGFLLAYPINVWLVAHGMKHGLMTVRTGTQKGSTTQRHAGQDAHDMSGMAGGSKQHGDESHDGGAEEHASHPAGGRGSGVTRTQLAAITFCTVLALVAGMYVPATAANFRLSAESVGRAIMPPGMIMTPDSPAEAMRDMAAADPRLVTYEAPANARGDRLLAPRMEGDVKVFDLDASVIRWNILPWKTVTAYAVNQQVPGPRLELTEGDHVRINFTNHLPDSATMHWHGLIVPNRSDGPGYITQIPVAPGGRYRYEFIVQQSGTYFYHSHTKPDRQQAFGLYGALIIKPRSGTTNEPPVDVDYVVQLQEWLNRDGLTYPAMIMEGALPNYFTINGKAYPATDIIHVRVGQRIKFRIIGTNNNFIHPMHMHGGPFTVVARDGIPLGPAAFQADVVNVGPGQRYDVIWPARVPGKWIFHCHIPHHTLNNNIEERGGGGLTLLVDVAP
jgi:manganese oxidase